MADAREGGIHFLAAGHYASETFGVRKLGELLAGKFGVDHAFVEVPNPDLERGSGHAICEIAGNSLRRPATGVKLGARKSAEED